MPKSPRSTPRREESLSRERIIEASIELLDRSGEDGLTFRALSERLATGPGAIYWHIANKHDLLIAACDSIVARTMEECVASATPEATLRALALAIFDTIDAHPWVGSVLRAPGQLPIIRMVEGITRQVRALSVPDEDLWVAVSALFSFILGVGGQNAAHTQFARTQGLDRSHFLNAVATVWEQLDPDEYPCTRSLAAPLRTHDDRVDFLAGIDLILSGIKGGRPTASSRLKGADKRPRRPSR